MHELERVLEAELQDDAVGQVRVRRAVPGALVEPAMRSELDSAAADVREHAGSPVWTMPKLVELEPGRGSRAGRVDDGMSWLSCGDVWAKVRARRADNG
jgi:hypothetical protein